MSGEIESFDGKNFEIWKMQMEGLLWEKRLYQHVMMETEDGIMEVSGEKLEKQMIGLSIIRRHIKPNILKQVPSNVSIPELFDTLQEMYASNCKLYIDWRPNWQELGIIHPKEASKNMRLKWMSYIMSYRQWENTCPIQRK